MKTARWQNISTRQLMIYRNHPTAKTVKRGLGGVASSLLDLGLTFFFLGGG
jgi:hypothetical protein